MISLENARLHNIKKIINKVLSDYEPVNPAHVARIDATKGYEIEGPSYRIVLQHSKDMLLNMEELDDMRARLLKIGIFFDGICSLDEHSLEVFLLDNIDAKKRLYKIEKEIEEENKK